MHIKNIHLQFNFHVMFCSDKQKTKIIASSPTLHGKLIGKQWKQWQTFADGDCSHEIKRCLLLGREAMTNLDSILKSRDIAFLIKVCLVKAMIFPVVMYGCDYKLDYKES